MSQVNWQIPYVWAALVLAAYLLAACAPAPTATPATASATPAGSAAATATATTAATPTATAMAATAAPGATPMGSGATGLVCVLRPAMTEGPYFVDGQPERSDVRSDTATNTVSPGIPLTLTFTIASQSGGSCIPLAGARIDIWHTDALGIYSGVAGKSGNAMRGWQTTDASGTARFTTVYPGWYRGRTPHIHFKIRVPTASQPPPRSGQIPMAASTAS